MRELKEGREREREGEGERDCERELNEREGERDGVKAMKMCVCVCVCEREREREGGGVRLATISPKLWCRANPSHMLIRVAPLTSKATDCVRVSVRV